jgi:hypothetical protein
VVGTRATRLNSVSLPDKFELDGSEMNLAHALVYTRATLPHRKRRVIDEVHA